MRQYTRAYINDDGAVQHLHTQDTPITIEPVDAAMTKVNFVIEHDGVDHLDAAYIRKNLQYSGGALTVKAEAAETFTIVEGE